MAEDAPRRGQSFCPYVGLQPFTVEDRAYFFGREREQHIISANLFAAPLTVLYGPSAVGKSSVLQAGVIPRLAMSAHTAARLLRALVGIATISSGFAPSAASGSSRRKASR